MDTSARRGRACGHGYGGSELAAVSAMVERREGGEGENGGAVRAIQTALAGLSAAPRKLAGRRWHGRVCAHGEHALGVLLARWRRRLASASWAGPHSAGPQLGR